MTNDASPFTWQEKSDAVPVPVSLTFAQREKDLRRGADILHSGSPGSDGAPQHTVKNLRNILLALEVNAVEVPDEQEEEAGVVHLL